MKPPTAFEQKVLDVLLRELRRAMKQKAQLSVLIDPWVAGGGTYVFAAPQEHGHTYSIEKGERTT